MLVRFDDSATGCWSRVDLESGEPIWISVARTGIVVKVSRLGFLGAKLFAESDLSKLALICKDLAEGSDEAPQLPTDMKNLVLRLMTSTALQSPNAAALGAKFASSRARIARGAG